MGIFVPAAHVKPAGQASGDDVFPGQYIPFVFSHLIFDVFALHTYPMGQGAGALDPVKQVKPVGQGRTAVPLGQNMPNGHGWYFVLFNGQLYPGGHKGQLDCPGEQNAHTLSKVAVHARTTYWPMLHCVQGTREELLGQYVELITQLVHTLLVVAVHADCSYWPGEHMGLQLNAP